jgi:hypothetical protein
VVDASDIANSEILVLFAGRRDLNIGFYQFVCFDMLSKNGKKIDIAYRPSSFAAGRLYKQHAQSPA